MQITEELQLPYGEIVGEPVTFGRGTKLAFILQNVVRVLDESLNEKIKIYNVFLCLYSYGDDETSIQYKYVTSFLGFVFTTKIVFLGV